METANQAANFLVGGCGGAAFLGISGKRFEIAAGKEGFDESGGDALQFGGGGDAAFHQWRCGMAIAREFVEADGNGLAKVHGTMVFTGGNAQQPVAMAEVFIGETTFFGSE